MQITLSDDLAKIVTAHAKSRDVSPREAAEALLRTGVSRIKALTKYNKSNGEAKPAKAKKAPAKKAAKPAKAAKAPKAKAKAAKPAKAKGAVAQRRAKAKESAPTAAASTANGIAKPGGWPAGTSESAPPATE